MLRYVFYTCFFMLMSFAIAVSAQSAYTITDLGTLGGPTSNATGINNDGVVIGMSQTLSGESVAFIWDGQMHELAGLPGNVSRINDAGDIIGGYTIVDEPANTYAQYSFVYRKGEVTVLPGTNTNATSISKKFIVGWYPTPVPDTQGIYDAFAYNLKNSKMKTLPKLGACIDDPNAPCLRWWAIAADVNSDGVIVGYSNSPTTCYPCRNDIHAVRWVKGKVQDLELRIKPTIDIGTVGGSQSWANAINDSGTIVGGFYYPTGSGYDIDAHPFVWSNGNAIDLLPEAEYGEFSQAIDINASSQIIGSSNHGGSFLYQDGVIQYLNDLLPAGSGWDSVSAVAINDAGQIIGNGVRSGDTNVHAFIMNPVP